MVASPVSLTSLVPGLDPEVDAIVRRALAKAREKRFPDAASMGEALERCRQRAPAEPVSARREAAGKATSASDTAYQRAIALYERGALEAARRFAVEALAEDPNHSAARALLTRVQSERKPGPARPPTQAASKAAGASASRTPTIDDPTAPTVHIPAVQRSDTVGDLPPTIMVKPGNWPRQPNPADATVLIPPGSRPKTPPPAMSSSAARFPPVEAGAPSGFDPVALLGGSGTNAPPGRAETILAAPPAARRQSEMHPLAKATPVASKAQPARPMPKSNRWAPWSALAAARKPRATSRANQSWWSQYGLSLAIAGGLVIVIAGIVVGGLYFGGFSAHQATCSPSRSR